jgi:hypothetical protein
MRHIKSYRLFETSISPLLTLSNNVDNELVSKIKSLINRGSKILEISCGNGSDAIELSNSGYNVITTELNDEYIDFVRSQGVECIKHDTKERFPFSSGEFNLVYSRFGLHYFNQEELIGIFEEIKRLTTRYLVFTVKLVDDNMQWGKVIFTEETWKDLVSKEFMIISSEIKEGLQYGNQSKWLEIVAKK